ncbi:MerR family transcriptional regulator [Mycolicibacterium monacense]|uniref:HTH-type transcriptional activator TipA n=1 Tax=Mycolicibacterium monacense TaxID=85693 RepID=A0AAD1MZQ4_MYCMB|nr:MerR family transcriptional regulator [Mycolicibacterium monacense]OBB63089.1 transcriptional regulator [Mycolicibacterium monacense]OBF50127.1 transcriptional regulator [Mycolicibacterium monacense]ORB17577.1 MerR family transcriptional regulator [Mycolicibacterium monacense DSM 44395]QHP88752.1 MerR family transcriptional regulator [Mycolicibacterium monacense DSM 44395]BBZ63803.1 HTH-type transcriptional activator TipA [Mycolicibacterium monacense]
MQASTVGTVAALTGVSVRTLHHYDHIGLVVPSVRTAAGYRGYTDADVERLHLVLVFRSVGLPLEEIRTLLDDPQVDVVARLERQLELLHERADRIRHTIKAVEELMNAHRDGIQLTAQEQVEIFGSVVHTEDHAAEAQQRWGDTEAWRQSRQRTARMSKRDWIEVRDEGEALLADLVAAKRDGIAPGSPEADRLAARHRASIERFYDCDDAMQLCLVQMYLADERFTRHYDDREPGLARYLHDVVVASIER